MAENWSAQLYGGAGAAAGDPIWKASNPREGTVAGLVKGGRPLRRAPLIRA